MTFADVVGAIQFLVDHLWVLGVGAAAIVIGWLLGFLGSASLGWRGRLYGAMAGGMMLNLVAKLEEASYATAFALMAVVTTVTFLLGVVHRARIFAILTGGRR
jgi:hypothetical protein